MSAVIAAAAVSTESTVKSTVPHPAVVAMMGVVIAAPSVRVISGAPVQLPRFDPRSAQNDHRVGDDEEQPQPTHDARHHMR